MNYIFGAEEYNWLIEQEGVTEVVMTDGVTKITFNNKKAAEMAFTNLKPYEMNHYSMCENIILLLPQV